MPATSRRRARRADNPPGGGAGALGLKAGSTAPRPLRFAQRAESLRAFLAEYAEAARLPPPKAQSIRWSSLLSQLRHLFDFQYTVEPPELVSTVDPRQIEQVLINLLKNAVEAGSSAEALRVRVERLEDGSVEIVVEDGACAFAHAGSRSPRPAPGAEPPSWWPRGEQSAFRTDKAG